MKRLVWRWRRSILLQVTAATVLLSLSTLSLVGTGLYIQISDGIYREKNNAVLSEARSLADYTQAQLVITRYRPDIPVAKVIADAFHAKAVSPTTTVRETILFAPPNVKKGFKVYQGASNNVDQATIPKELRQRVEKSFISQSMRLKIRYKDSFFTTDAIAVGQTIVFPSDQIYEIYYLFPLTDQANLNTFVLNLLLGTVVILIIFIGLITWFVVRRVVLPVRDVAQIAEALSGGDLTQRLTIKSEDEMGRLAISFNEMALSMQQQISRLENLSRLQQRFVSDVSHELRTPLTTIRMASQLIFENREHLEPSAARSAELLIAQIERFDILLTDLLEVSRFDAREVILERKDSDIRAILLNVIDQLSTGDSSPVKLVAPDTELTAEVDPRRIERILRNLISNAIDHSEGQEVVVTMAQTDREVAIGVRDYGIGFNDREAARLFDRFWRADPSRSRTRGGTGLGLAIALDDTNLHQGTLKAWGRPNYGAHFVLTLPKKSGFPIEQEPILVVPAEQRSTILEETNTED